MSKTNPATDFEVSLFSRASILIVFCLLTSFLSGTACTSSGKPEPATPVAPGATNVGDTWPDKMQALSQTLAQLLPLVVSRAKFTSEKNFDKIESETRKLRALAHTLKHVDAPNADPAMQVMSGLFEDDIERALESLKSGNREYARQILSDTTSYCIQCHTQTNNGPAFPRLNLDLKVSDLPPVDQAEFYAATRQFDRALDTYRKALNDPNLAKNDPYEWEQSARAALAITVRVKNDADSTAAFLTHLDGSPDLPTSTRQAMVGWKNSVQEWRKEKAPPAHATPLDQLHHSEELIHRAASRQQFPLDHSQDIVYFRAASQLHELLQVPSTNPEFTAKILLNAGLAEEATRDMNFWTLHETYYEQCVRKLPHSKTAEACFAHLQDSLTLGYSGSAGVHLPPEVAQRLKTLQTLAAVQAKP